MRNLITFLLAISAIFTLNLFNSQMSFAQCVVTGSTPDGGEVVVCTGTDLDGLVTTNQADDVTIENGADITRGVDDPVELLDGNDKVLMNGGSVSSDSTSDRCIRFNLGNNEFHMKGGSLDCGHGVRTSSDAGPSKVTIDDGIITADDEAIHTGDGADEIYVNGGDLSAQSAVIQTDGGDDKVIITGGILTQIGDDDEAINTRSGNDLISVSNATIDGSTAFLRRAIFTRDDNDTVKLGTGARILGLSNGGDGFDTLVFEMGVTETLIPNLCSLILLQDPQQGEITINGLFYEWEDFEVILCELVPAEPRPIPTLSEWGLIAMAGVIGIAALVAIRKSRVSA